MSARPRVPRYRYGAQVYDVVSLERLVYRQGRQAAIAALGLRPGDRVLDVGCGTGLNLPLLTAAGVGAIVGVDASASMLSRARRRVEAHGWSHVKLVEGDAAQLDRVVGGPFDAVLFTYALSVVEDGGAAWQQAWGLLRPGGRIAVVDTALPVGRWRVLEPLARLALFTGGVHASREVWCRVLDSSDDTSYEVMNGGHVHVAVGTKPPSGPQGRGRGTLTALEIDAAAPATADASVWSSDELTPPDGVAWDLLVIGGGTAGLVGAKAAAGFGASVLLVERDRLGGDCLWSGCVPSKALLGAAHAARDARVGARYGVHSERVTVDFPAVMAHVRAAMTTIAPVDSPEAMRAVGVSVAHGSAQLTGRHTAQVDGQPVPFRQVLIATGATAVVPPVPGLAAAHPLTNESVFTLTQLPNRLLLLGGGSIGCELGQAFARLGSRVTLVESADRLLGREDADGAAVVTQAMVDDGVDVRTGAELVAVRPDGGSFVAELADGSEVGFDAVLVAVGRRPRTSSIGLERAGVEVDERGHVRVDALLRTTNPHAWAAGDLTGHPPFTHTAGVHGSLAASNAVLGLRRRVDAALTPRVTFTQPEVAAVGVGLAQARAQGLTVHTVAHTEVDRAVAEQRTGGFSRLVLDARGRVVGATVVGPRAGESLAEAVLAARQGLRARDLAASTHAYPTYGDGLWKAALAQVQEQLASGLTGRATHALVAVRRVTLRRR